MFRHFMKTCHVKLEKKQEIVLFEYLSIGKITDVQRRYVTCVIISSLSSESSKKPIVLTIENLDKANFQTILKLFHDSICILCSEKVLYNFNNLIKFYVTDVSPYMLKSVQMLKVFCPKHFHDTCMAFIEYPKSLGIHSLKLIC